MIDVVGYDVGDVFKVEVMEAEATQHDNKGQTRAEAPFIDVDHVFQPGLDSSGMCGFSTLCDRTVPVGWVELTAAESRAAVPGDLDGPVRIKDDLQPFFGVENDHRDVRSLTPARRVTESDFEPDSYATRWCWTL